MATLAEQIREWYQLYQVNKDGHSIIGLKNPSEKVQLAAVNQNPDAILHIENPSEEVQLAAVQQNGNYIQTIFNPSERVQLAAVNQHGYFIETIDNPSERVQMVAVEKDLGNITLIDSPSEAVQIYVAERDPFSVSLYPSSETARMVAIEIDPKVIMHIENPSPALCKAAIEAELPGTKISHADPFLTQELFNRIETTGQKQSYETLENERLLQTQNRIEAIQVLQGNAPEQISVERFSGIRKDFPYEVDNLLETLYDVETGGTYTDTRMMSDNLHKKLDIQEIGKRVAESIKDTLSPAESLKFAEEIATASNLPLGKTPTTEETLSLFSNQFRLKEFTSSVFENERTGQYEFQSPSVKYQQGASELLHAGTHPYSPNYKEVFEKAGLKHEFNEFEKACCARSRWNDAYNYGIAGHDIAEIGDLERALPALDERVENSRSLIYEKIGEIMNVKLDHADLLTTALSAYKESTFNLIDGLTTKIPAATAVEVQEINAMVIALSNPKTAFAIGEKADQYVSIFKALGVEQQFSDFREKWERLSQLCELSSDTNTANLPVEEKRLLLKEYIKAEDAFESATMELISDIKDRERLLAQPDVSSISKASYADSNQSAGLEFANDSVDKMKEQLRELGIPVSEQEKYITELLTFGRTNSLVPIQTSILNQEISALARLSIDINDNGEKILKLHFIRKDLSNDLKQPFMGHYFSEEQKRNLISTQNAGEVIQITNAMGKSQLVLASVDKLTGELVAQPVEKVMIPDTFRGARLSDEDKLRLKAGQSVIVENVKAGKNTAYNITVQYSADFNKVVALADSNKITIVGGSRLSLKESEELRKGKTIQVSNLIDDKGEKYSAFVRVRYPKEEILITPTNEHKVQVSHNNHGEKTEKNKRLEKSSGQSPVKSGSNQVKRTKRRIN